MKIGHKNEIKTLSLPHRDMHGHIVYNLWHVTISLCALECVYHLVEYIFFRILKISLSVSFYVSYKNTLLFTSHFLYVFLYLETTHSRIRTHPRCAHQIVMSASNLVVPLSPFAEIAMIFPMKIVVHRTRQQKKRKQPWVAAIVRMVLRALSSDIKNVVMKIAHRHT